MKLFGSSAAVTPQHSAPASTRQGVSVDELLALRQADLVVPPELAGELGHPAMRAPAGGDRLRLGPPPVVSADPAFVRRVVGDLLATYERRRTLPAQASAEGAVCEAKMIAVLSQLRRLQLEITAFTHRPV